MTRTDEYAAWVRTQSGYLVKAQAGEGDAVLAAHLSWIIRVSHSMCFDGELLPVEYDLAPDEWYEYSIAACSSGGAGGEDRYVVYPRQLLSRIERYRQSQAPDRSTMDILWCIAAHEVRHRVQSREKNVVMFTSDSRRQPGVDPVIAVVCWLTCGYLADQERCWRERGKSEEFIRFACGPVEFDACVIERLYLNQLRRAEPMPPLKRFIRRNGPAPPIA